MARWFPSHNYTPTDSNSLQAVAPTDGDYTDLASGDMAFVYLNAQLDVFVYDSTSSTTQNIPNVVTSDGNAGNGRWLRKEFSVQYSNGFEIQIGPQPDSLATIGVSGTTFTLGFVSEYSYFVQGAKYTVSSGDETVEITDVHGMHWIYFDNTGTMQIQAPGGSTDDLILENCLVAAVYWDAVANAAILLFDERHGNGITPAAHYHWHETEGAKFESGLGLSGFDIDGSGADATAAQFDVNSGEFHDEDNEIELAEVLNATIDTMYREGAGGPWFKADATTNFPVADGSIGDRLDWNDINGGTWQRLEVANNSYVLCHYFATNDQLGNGFVGIMGQNTYANANQARTGAEVELASLLAGDLPLSEILPIATVIFQTSDSYSNQVAARTISTDTGDDYIDWRQVTITATGSTVGDHESLSGILGGAAADHYHLTGAQETDLTDGGETILHFHEQVNYSGTIALEATADGANILDTSGDDPVLRLVEDDGTTEALTVSSVSGSDIYIQGIRDSGEIWLSARDSGSVERWAGIDPDTPSFHPSPNDSLSLGRSGAVWADVWATDTTINTSDRKKKKDIVPAEGLQFINRLNPVKFKWLKGTRNHWGLLADEVKTALDDEGIDSGLYVDPLVGDPELDPDIHTKALRLGELIPVLTRAIQELSDKLNNVEALADSLYIRNTTLTDLVDLQGLRLDALEKDTFTASTKKDKI